MEADKLDSMFSISPWALPVSFLSSAVAHGGSRQTNCLSKLKTLPVSLPLNFSSSHSWSTHKAAKYAVRFKRANVDAVYVALFSFIIQCSLYLAAMPTLYNILDIKAGKMAPYPSLIIDCTSWLHIFWMTKARLCHASCSNVVLIHNSANYAKGIYLCIDILLVDVVGCKSLPNAYVHEINNWSSVLRTSLVVCNGIHYGDLHRLRN